MNDDDEFDDLISTGMGWYQSNTNGEVKREGINQQDTRNHKL